MSPLNKTYTHDLYKIVGLICSIIFVAAGAGLGQVWLRESISKKTDQLSRYEVELSNLERQIQDYDTRIAQIHNPETLKAYVAKYDLGMQLPDAGQVVVLDEPMYQDLDIKERESGLVLAKTESPFRRTFDLAVVEASKTKK
jgi:hypothetical protein